MYNFEKFLFTKELNIKIQIILINTSFQELPLTVFENPIKKPVRIIKIKNFL